MSSQGDEKQCAFTWVDAGPHAARALLLSEPGHTQQLNRTSPRRALLSSLKQVSLPAHMSAPWEAGLGGQASALPTAPPRSYHGSRAPSPLHTHACRTHEGWNVRRVDVSSLNGVFPVRLHRVLASSGPGRFLRGDSLRVPQAHFTLGPSLMSPRAAPCGHIWENSHLGSFCARDGRCLGPVARVMLAFPPPQVPLCAMTL